MQINLLAPKSVQVRKQKSEVSSFLPMVAGIFIVLSLVAAAIVQVMSYTVNQDIAEAKVKILNLRKAEEQIKLRKTYQADFNQIKKVEETLSKIKPTYTKDLDAITQVMPRSITLQEIILDEQPPVMRVRGTAPNQQLVVQMGMQMHNQPLLSKAEIVTSKKEENLYEFEITIQGGGK